MAISGTTTQQFNNNGVLVVTIVALTNTTNCQPFDLKGLTHSSYVVGGVSPLGVVSVFGGATAQWQGSNDGGTTWVNIGTGLTSAGGGNLTADEMFFGLYQLVITGGGGTTSINAVVNGVIDR